MQLVLASGSQSNGSKTSLLCGVETAIHDARMLQQMPQPRFGESVELISRGDGPASIRQERGGMSYIGQGCVQQAAKWLRAKPSRGHAVYRSLVAHGTADHSVICLFSGDMSAVEHISCFPDFGFSAALPAAFGAPGLADPLLFVYDAPLNHGRIQSS